MARIEKFEDLLAWQLARDLTKQTYQLWSAKVSPRDFTLCNQMQRAVISMMSNIAEGFERSTKKNKIHFFIMARVSCGELRSLLYVCLANQKLDLGSVTSLQEQVTRTGQLVSGLIRSLRKLPTEYQSAQ